MPMTVVANLSEGTSGPVPGIIPVGEFAQPANEAIAALLELREAMAGEAERVGLDSEEAIVAYVKEIRHERARARANKAA